MSSKAVDELITSIRTWPSHDVAELLDVARVIEARRIGVYEMSAGEREAVTEGRSQARRGDFVSDQEMEAVWARLGA